MLVSPVKVIYLLNKIALPLILYGLEVGLHCAALPPWRLLVFINLSLVLAATYYKPISPNITLLGCHT